MDAIVLFAALMCFAQQVIGNEEILAKIKEYHLKCLDSTNLDIDILRKARQGLMMEDEKVQDHFFCFAKVVGFQNEQGIIQPDVIRHIFETAYDDPALVEEYSTKCNKQRETPTITAAVVAKCLMETLPQTLRQDIFTS